MTDTTHLHPLSAVTTALRGGLIGLSIPIFLIGILSSVFDVVPASWGLSLAPVGLLAGFAYGIAYYYRFEYALTEDTVDVASGVFSRRAREIPYRRIQNVDVRQGVIHRLLNLAILSIETAGGGNTEATLNFVSESEASRLQREIRRRTARRNGQKSDSRRSQGVASSGTQTAGSVGATDDTRDGASTDEFEHGPSRPGADVDVRGEPTPETDDESTAIDGERAGDQPYPPEPSDETEGLDEEYASDESDFEPSPYDEPLADDSPRLLFGLEPRELLLYSFTTVRPAAAAGILALAFFFTDSIVALLLTTAQPFGGPTDLATATPSSYVVLGLVSIANGVIITYLVSVTYTFVTYYDFRLGRAGDDFVYERGLLQRYSGSIPSEKVQSVTITDNPLQRYIEYAGLWVETAGYGPDSSGGSSSAVPLASAGRVHTFAENLTGVETPRFEQPPTIARRRYLVRYSLVVAVLVAVVYGVSSLVGFQHWYFAAILFLSVPPAAHLRYVNLGYYVGDDHLVIRRGFWRRRTTVIPYYRIQTISNRRSVFQRRLGLTSVVVDTASSATFIWDPPTIYDVRLADGRETASTARKRLQTALRERRAEDDPETGFSVDFT
ncbi:PH domain-containing protein [Natronosalvus vescus]|uniref:PH domain-containing protein n=1 Tax=Natronosalvus vescus TaxID=2953881 RepID=UPI0020902F37|nr:PH domain-containing protein [Natronosalvus vescus]